ncbi:MAG: chemotaxis protein CheD [Deltaproteobacteria bacterium]|nr:chemotaxis protein CheD [Deltaproteobacteria bacterium]
MDNQNKHYLYPGTLFVSRTPFNVTTVLGSCISVTLTDPVSGVGGINHFMIPLWNGEGLATPKFGNVAIKKLINEMILNGAERKRLQAKIFGGSSLYKNGSSTLDIGRKNIKIAEKMLDEEGIPVTNCDTGGSRGRKVLFFTDTGIVRIRMLNMLKIKDK